MKLLKQKNSNFVRGRPREVLGLARYIFTKMIVVMVAWRFSNIDPITSLERVKLGISNLIRIVVVWPIIWHQC